MEQYISKSALVAEIEKRIKVSQDYAKCNLTEKTRIGNHAQQLELNDILSFINTLEVKEVDLARENLTWKDIRELYIIFAEIDAEIEFCKTDIQGETIGYYQEALKRFNAQKGK